MPGNDDLESKDEDIDKAGVSGSSTGQQKEELVAANDQADDTNLEHKLEDAEATDLEHDDLSTKEQVEDQSQETEDVELVAESKSVESVSEPQPLAVVDESEPSAEGDRSVPAAKDVGEGLVGNEASSLSQGEKEECAILVVGDEKEKTQDDLGSPEAKKVVQESDVDEVCAKDSGSDNDNVVTVDIMNEGKQEEADMSQVVDDHKQEDTSMPQMVDDQQKESEQGECLQLPDGASSQATSDESQHQDVQPLKSNPEDVGDVAEDEIESTGREETKDDSHRMDFTNASETSEPEIPPGIDTGETGEPEIPPGIDTDETGEPEIPPGIDTGENSELEIPPGIDTDETRESEIPPGSDTGGISELEIPPCIDTGENSESGIPPGFDAGETSSDGEFHLTLSSSDDDDDVVDLTNNTKLATGVSDDPKLSASDGSLKTSEADIGGGKDVSAQEEESIVSPSDKAESDLVKGSPEAASSDILLDGESEDVSKATSSQEDLTGENGGSRLPPSDAPEMDTSKTDAGESKDVPAEEKELHASLSGSPAGDLVDGTTASSSSNTLPGGESEDLDEATSAQKDEAVVVSKEVSSDHGMLDEEVDGKVEKASVAQEESTSETGADEQVVDLTTDSSEVDLPKTTIDGDEAADVGLKADESSIVPKDILDVEEKESDENWTPSADVVSMPQKEDTAVDNAEDRILVKLETAKKSGPESMEIIKVPDESEHSINKDMEASEVPVTVNRFERGMNIFDIFKSTKGESGKKDSLHDTEETNEVGTIHQEQKQVEENVQKVKSSSTPGDKEMDTITNHDDGITEVLENDKIQKIADEDMLIQRDNGPDRSVKTLPQESAQSSDESFQTPPSSPSQVIVSVTKTPIVVLHDLRCQSSSGDLTNDASVNLEDQMEDLPNVEEDKVPADEVREDEDSDGDSIVEVDVVSDCEVFSDSSDQGPSGMLANILEEVLPKQIKSREDNVNMQENEEPVTETIEDNDVRLDSVANTSIPSKVDESCNDETSLQHQFGSSEANVTLQNTTAQENVHPSNESMLGNREEVEQSVQDALASKTLDSDEARGDGEKEGKADEESDDDDVIEILDDEEEVGDDRIPGAGEMSKKETAIANKSAAPEAGKELQSEERNVFNIIPSRNAATVEKTSVSSDSSSQAKKDPRCISPNWKNALREFIKKSVEVQLARGKEPEEKADERKRHESEPALKVTPGVESLANAEGDEKTSNLAAGETQSGNHPKKQYRRQSESLTDFDDFVPESNLDVIDISQPGRKKYPMRSTARRLLRIAETGDDDDAHDDECTKTEGDLDKNDEKKAGREIRSRTPSGASSATSGNSDVKVTPDRSSGRKGKAPRPKKTGGSAKESVIRAAQFVEENKDQILEDASVEGGPRRSGRNTKEITPKRGLGRPRKNSVDSSMCIKGKEEPVDEVEDTQDVAKEVKEITPKRSLGRQRKNSVDSSVCSEDKEEPVNEVTDTQEVAKEVSEITHVNTEAHGRSRIPDTINKVEPKRGRGRPRKNSVDRSVCSGSKEKPVNEAKDTGRKLRDRTQKVQVDDTGRKLRDRTPKIQAEDDWDVSCDDIGEEEKMTRRNSSRRTMERMEIDFEERLVSASGRTLKPKIQTDFIQVDDDVQTDEDDFMLADDPPPKPRERTRKTKRVGSMSWKKDKTVVDPDWSPEMGNDSAAPKKSHRKAVKSLERIQISGETLTGNVRSCEGGEYKDSALYKKDKTVGDPDWSPETGNDLAASEKSHRKSAKSSETIHVSAEMTTGNMKSSVAEAGYKDSALYKKTLEDLTILALRRRKQLSSNTKENSAFEETTTADKKDVTETVVKTVILDKKEVKKTCGQKLSDSLPLLSENYVEKESSKEEISPAEELFSAIIDTNIREIEDDVSSQDSVDTWPCESVASNLSDRSEDAVVESGSAAPLDLSIPKKDGVEVCSPVTSPNPKASTSEPEVVNPDMVTPKKAVCVAPQQTSPILRSCLTTSEKRSSPGVIEIRDDRQSSENTSETKLDQVFIPMLSPKSPKLPAPQLPVQRVLSPTQMPKMAPLPRSPIVSPTHPLPPPQYYTIVQPASKEQFSQPGGTESSAFGPTRVRGRIRMRGGGRQPMVLTPRAPYQCQTRLNRPPTIQVIPTISPLHQMQSIQNKILVQKDVMNDARLVVSGNSLQPIHRMLTPQAINSPVQMYTTGATQQSLPTVLGRGSYLINNNQTSAAPIRHSGPFQINATTTHQRLINQPSVGQPMRGVLQQTPVAAPMQQQVSSPDVEIIGGHQPGIVQVRPQQMQVANAQPKYITVQVSTPQPVHLQQQRPQPFVVSTVGGMVIPQASTVGHIANVSASNLLPTNAQLIASGILPSQGATNHSPVSSVAPIPPTAPTAIDRQHYVSILRHSLNSMRSKSPNKALIQGTTNQIATSIAATLGVLPPLQATVAQAIPVRTTYSSPVTPKSNMYVKSSRAGMNPLATNMLNSLAQQHLTTVGHTRPRILSPNSAQPAVNKDGLYGHIYVSGAAGKPLAQVRSGPAPGQGIAAMSYPNLAKHIANQNEARETNALSVKQKTSPQDKEKLYGAKKRKTAHIGGSVWFDERGFLHGAIDQLTGDELLEITRTGQVPPRSSHVRQKTPSSLPKARTKVPTFGPSKDLDRVVVGGGEDGHGNQNEDGRIVPHPTAPNLRTHIVPKRRHDKWAAPVLSLSTNVPEPSTIADLESTEQSMVQSDLDQDEKMSLPPEEEEEDDSPSILLQIMEAESKKPKVDDKKDNEPHLVFEVTSDDGFSAKGTTMDEAWGKVISKVEERRSDTRMTDLSFAGINPLKILGVNHAALVFLIEQLYGAKNCQDYKFKYHQYYDAELDEVLEINESGACKTEPFKQRNYYDMFNFLASKHRKRPQPTDADEQEETMYKSARRATSISDLPMAMRFRHLKETAKEAVGVYRSRIHGRGLFCKRTIDAGEMIIEYTGTVIRSILTDKREKYYESKVRLVGQRSC
ncbi:uncharacterized protein [Amphiura filiformis]|uniref:uncharacterized protein n=1 Tax=Amphiura filiformis TaxID=82378 RepID=UPI003B21963A